MERYHIKPLVLPKELLSLGFSVHTLNTELGFSCIVLTFIGKSPCMLNTQLDNLETR